MILGGSSRVLRSDANFWMLISRCGIHCVLGNATVSAGAVCGCRHTVHENVSYPRYHHHLPFGLVCPVRRPQGNSFFSVASEESEVLTGSEICMRASQLPVHCELREVGLESNNSTSSFHTLSWRLNLMWDHCPRHDHLHGFYTSPCARAG